MLIEHDDAQPLGVFDAAGIGLEVTGEEPEKRRLSAAVRPEQPEARSGRKDEAQVVDQTPLTESLGDVLGDDEALGPPIGRGELDARGPRLLPGLHARQLFDHPPRALDARLCLRRSCLRPSPKPLDLAPHPVGQRLLPARLLA